MKFFSFGEKPAQKAVVPESGPMHAKGVTQVVEVVKPFLEGKEDAGSMQSILIQRTPEEMNDMAGRLVTELETPLLQKLVDYLANLPGGQTVLVNRGLGGLQEALSKRKKLLEEKGVIYPNLGYERHTQ